MNEAESYPRVLNGEGCLFGRSLARRFDVWKESLKTELKEDYRARMDKIEGKLDRLPWAAVSVAIALMTTSLTLWITHLTP